VQLVDGIIKPRVTDYVAGAILANGFVWMWLEGLNNLSAIFSKVPVGLLADVSFVIYLSGGILSSYLVCKRTSTGHLFVGLKLAALAWIISLFFMLSAAAEPTIGLALTLLACFAAGGIAGAYLALRSTLRRAGVRKPPLENAE
jgi:hypothetical protein